MPFQELPFNGDTFIEKKFKELKEKYGLTTAVETGTCLGSTTLFLSENFDRVHTVEINVDYLTLANNRFKQSGAKNIFPHWEDSGVFLSELILKNQIGDDTIFFLDGHWGDNCPLLDELDAIQACGLKPVIAIHDFKVPNTNLGYDSYEGYDFDLALIHGCLDRIYGEGKWTHEYNTESEGAKRGIIYITKND